MSVLSSLLLHNSLSSYFSPSSRHRRRRHQRQSPVVIVHHREGVGDVRGRGKAVLAAEYLLKLHELSFTTLWDSFLLSRFVVDIFSAQSAVSGASQTKGFRPLLDVFSPSNYRIFRASHTANRWCIINQMFANSMPVDARALFRLIWLAPRQARIRQYKNNLSSKAGDSGAWNVASWAHYQWN